MKIDRLGRLFRREEAQPLFGGSDVDGNRVTLLRDGEEAFPAMLAAISNAKREVLIAMYWFDSDATGRKFADALIERAQSGVRVFVTYDAVGSISADGAIFDRMRAAGCDVREFNPVAPWRARFSLGMINRRDHRKLLIVDSRIAITGGVNLSDLWAPTSQGGEGWRDDAVSVEGESAERLRETFMTVWKWLGGVVPRLPTIPPKTNASVGSRVRVLANRSLRDRRTIRRAYLEQIRGAKVSIYISNSYFLPDRAIRRELARAVRRGVDVRVLLAGKSDVIAVYYASRYLYSSLLAQGIRIFEWTRSTFHSKTAVVDGVWSTIGSYNLDNISWRLNLELNVAITDPVVGSAMQASFHRDCEEGVAIHRQSWRARPLLPRFLERFFFFFRKFL